MKEFHKYLAATFLSCAMFCTGANAMQVSQWDALSDSQKKDFTIVLLSGAINNLKANGHSDQVSTLMDLFFNKDPAIATGMQHFIDDIGLVRQKNATLPPDRQYEVETAFYLTLNDHGINVSLPDLLTIGKTYQVPTAASGSPH